MRLNYWIVNGEKYLRTNMCLTALMPEAIFFEISFTWNSQFRFSSIYTLRDFAVDTGIWFILMEGFSGRLVILCLDPINKNSVFVKFSVSLLAASHNQISSRSEFIHSFISSTLLLAKVVLVLSAYILGCEWHRQLHRSFIYNKNKRGP